MTREEIIRMAREAKVMIAGDAAWRLCELVAAAEREACAAEIADLRNANEAFAARQEWWNDRMVALEAAVLAEREACAVLVETLLGENPDLSEVFIAAEIRARGEE